MTDWMRFKRRGRTERQFWMRVKIGDGCWEMGGARTRDGYAMFGRAGRGHRVSWALSNGPIPPGMLVCHTCDNRTCVRPSHLFLGTVKDNSDDKVAKGRQVRGETNRGGGKLTEEDVVCIRRRAALGERQYVIAREFGIGQTMVSNIVLHRNWKHVRAVP